MKPDFVKLTAKSPQGDRHVWIARSEVIMVERLPAGMGSGVVLKPGAVQMQVRETPEMVMEKMDGLRLDGPVSALTGKDMVP